MWAAEWEGPLRQRRCSTTEGPAHADLHGTPRRVRGSRRSLSPGPIALAAWFLVGSARDARADEWSVSLTNLHAEAAYLGSAIRSDGKLAILGHYEPFAGWSFGLGEPSGTLRDCPCQQGDAYRPDEQGACFQSAAQRYVSGLELESGAGATFDRSQRWLEDASGRPRLEGPFLSFTPQGEPVYASSLLSAAASAPGRCGYFVVGYDEYGSHLGPVVATREHCLGTDVCPGGIWQRCDPVCLRPFEVVPCGDGSTATRCPDGTYHPSQDVCMSFDGYLVGSTRTESPWTYSETCDYVNPRRFVGIGEQLRAVALPNDVSVVAPPQVDSGGTPFTLEQEGSGGAAKLFARIGSERTKLAEGQIAVSSGSLVVDEAGRTHVAWIQRVASSGCPAFSATYTAWATQNYATCAIPLQAGDSILIGMCSDTGGAVGAGLAVHRLVAPDGAQLYGQSAGSCGGIGKTQYTAPVSGTYVLREGCRYQSSCSGQFGYVLNGAVPTPNFALYYNWRPRGGSFQPTPTQVALFYSAEVSPVPGPRLAAQAGSGAAPRIAAAWVASRATERSLSVADWPLGAPEERRLRQLSSSVGVGTTADGGPLSDAIDVAINVDGALIVAWQQGLSSVLSWRDDGSDAGVTTEVRNPGGNAKLRPVRLRAQPYPAAHPDGASLVHLTFGQAYVGLFHATFTPPPSNRTITGTVRLGEGLPLRNIAVSMVDGTPQANCVQHADRPGKAPCDPVKTGDDGKYAFTPKEALPAGAKVRVSFEMAAPDGTFGGDRSVGWTLPNGTTTPYVQLAVNASGSTNFDFDSLGLQPDVGDNFGAIYAPDSRHVMARMRGMARTYLAFYEALRIAPARLTDLIPGPERMRVVVLQPGAVNPQGGAGYYYGTICGQAKKQPEIAIGLRYFDEEPAYSLDATALHELSHYYMEQLFGCLPHVETEAYHAGYRNASTNSSWTEGFATFLATLLRSRILDPRPDIGTPIALFATGGLVGTALQDFPRAGQYQVELRYTTDDEKLRGGLEERRVAQLLWKLTNEDESNPRPVNVDLFRKDPRAWFRDEISVQPATLLHLLRVGTAFEIIMNPPWALDAATLLDHPADMYALYQHTRAAFTPALFSEAKLSSLFAAHGFFVDEGGNTYWDVLNEPAGRAAHSGLDFAEDKLERRMPQPALGTDLVFDAVEANGSAAAVDELHMDVIYDAPFEDHSYSLTAPNPGTGAIAVELPEPHYSARAFIMARRKMGSATTSVPLILTSRQYEELRAAQSPGSTAFMSVSFAYKAQAGEVSVGSPAIVVSEIGSAPGGKLVEFRAQFAESQGHPLIYSWSTPAATFPGASMVRAVLPDGEHVISVYACNDTGVCANAATAVTIVVPSDTQAPSLICPASVVDDGVGADGAIVTLPAATASDDQDPSPIVTCDPSGTRLFPYGTSTVLCTAVDAAGNAASCSFEVLVRDVTPPTIECPLPVRLDGTGPGGATVAFAPATATDNHDPNPTVLCDRIPGEVFAHGDTEVQCSATDVAGNDSSCGFLVTVIDTPPRLVLVGPLVVIVECADAFSEPGFQADDVRDGDLTSRVHVSSQLNTSSPGSYLLEYSVADVSGNRSSVLREVQVVDTAVPTLSVGVSPNELWPPNHRMVPIAVSLGSSDRCDEHPRVELISVASNEPEDGQGDGDTENDIQGASVGTPDAEILLRAEREGGGSGRVYTLTFRATDASGNASVASNAVRVPRSKGH